MDTTDLARAFGEQIKQLRTEAGWSQEAFADRCHLHRTYIGSIERGEKNVTLFTAQKLADGLNVKLSALLARLEG